MEFTFNSTSEYAYEVLTAALAEKGFESFLEEDGALKAYIQEQEYETAEIEEEMARLLHKFPFTYTSRIIPPENWNQQWESNFPPIQVENRIRVRALFHEPDPSFPIEIIIQPKMSFGTGHHATTWLVMREMLKIDFTDKYVLDFGTGSGILAILAAKQGASDVWAVDNDPQCIENSQENFSLNGTPLIHLALGDITVLPAGKNFNVIIGNITRNVILQFLPAIKSRLRENGLFLASGFYEEDLPVLVHEASASGLHLQRYQVGEKWCMAVFESV